MKLNLEQNTENDYFLFSLIGDSNMKLDIFMISLWVTYFSKDLRIYTIILTT